MKTIVLTGATSGIGKEIARHLLKFGHTVISNARNFEKGDKVKSELCADVDISNLFIYESDFADFSSVLQFADQIKVNFKSIDVLINNVGTWEMDFKETKDGVETNLQVNHLSPMLLTLELIPLLKSSGNARIINTSSGAHRRDILNLDDLEFRNTEYNGIATYSQSKLLNILFSLELAGRLDGMGITINTIHPGYVKTNLFNKMGARDWYGIPDAAHGAKSALYAALSPEMEGVSGKYLYISEEDPNLSELAKDKSLAAKAWDISLRIIKEHCSVPSIQTV